MPCCADPRVWVPACRSTIDQSESPLPGLGRLGPARAQDGVGSHGFGGHGRGRVTPADECFCMLFELHQAWLAAIRVARRVARHDSMAGMTLPRQGRIRCGVDLNLAPPSPIGSQATLGDGKTENKRKYQRDVKPLVGLDVLSRWCGCLDQKIHRRTGNVTQKGKSANVLHVPEEVDAFHAHGSNAGRGADDQATASGTGGEGQVLPHG